MGVGGHTNMFGCDMDGIEDHSNMLISYIDGFGVNINMFG